MGVIKNNQFTILVELPKSTKQTFNNLTIEAHLMYDCSPKPKPVLQVRQTPYKYKGIVERDDPRKCTLQVSISILSSQHENMNFVLELTARDSNSNKVVACGYSEPVHVISKPGVLVNLQGAKKKKRTWNDRITERLEPIEAKQNELLALQKAPKPEDTFDPFQILQVQPQHPSERFENAFYELIRAYNEMNEDERPTKVRKLVTGNEFDPSVSQLVSSLHQASKLEDSSQNFKPETLDYGTPVKNMGEQIPCVDFDLAAVIDNVFNDM